MGKAAKKISDESQKAAELVDQALVFDAASVFRIGGPGRPRLPMGNFFPDTGLIDDWQALGVNVISHPSAVFEADSYVGHIKLLAMWNSFIADNPERLVRIDKPESFDVVRETGRIGITIGTHHAEMFRTLDDIDYFFNLGLRSCILVLFGQNRLGTAVDEPSGGGLTSYGRQVLERMNSLGMAVDVSHCNNETRLGAIEASTMPVFFSHANPLGTCKNARNVSDEVIRAMAERGGVLGVMPLRMMLTDAEPTTVEHFVDQIAYICDLVGSDYVGIGTEAPIEGFDTLPAEQQIPLPAYMRNEGVQRQLDLPELYGTDRFRLIVETFIRRGFSDDDIFKVLGLNFERVLREIMGVHRQESDAPGVAPGSAELSYLKSSKPMS